ncbi:MAG TPA: DUF4962 domain-containing protein [Verrucomicrobiae bacterium]|nr:DUF4962 domain-containing protein [Verrucomicrobiae bacterium]
MWLRKMVCVPIFVLLPFTVAAQDAAELKAEQSVSDRLKGEHPLTALMREKHSRLRPELVGKHPRVYVDDAGLEVLRQRARTTHKALWQQALVNVRALKVAPPKPPAQERRVQNEVGMGIAEAALAYRIEGDKKYLAAAKKYMDAAVSYEVWGYTYNKPDVDLAAGHLLYGLGWGYDLLYNELTPAERGRYRAKLVRQAKLMHAFFAPKAGKTYAYSQNHTSIPIAGLGVAAYALYGEVPEAAQWAALSRAIFDRVLEIYSADGYFYEGFEYWIFSVPWLFHWLDAHAFATGEDLYDRPGLRNMHKYVAHSLLPDGQYPFDFGDTWEGSETRAKRGKEYPRSHPDGHFHTNWNLLYRIAARFKSGDAQGVAQWLQSFGHVNKEDYWSLLWHDATVAAVPIEKQPRWHYFPDHEVAFWRSDWTPKATALAFKAGPPEGHHAKVMLEQFPDWRLSAGHAHPDANSFILFANGAYLTGDSGYAGVPMTLHHNTVLVDGKGQAREGEGHDAWKDAPYARLDKTRIIEAKLDERGVRIRGNATGSYMPELGLQRFERLFEYTVESGVTVTDTLEAERAVAFTHVLHSDTTIVANGERRWRIDNGGARLAIELVEPVSVEATIEPNTLVGAGKPGSVDKGERVVRGERLLLETPPAHSARFIVKLQPQWPPAASR